jgi:hypothetical protein
MPSPQFPEKTGDFLTPPQPYVLIVLLAVWIGIG